jgi:lipoprotein-anchoring transpeptidase ErfK/SrfK
MNRRVLWVLFSAALAAVLASVGVASLALVSSIYDRHYAGRIMPGVGVYGTSLGGMTTGEAATLLASTLPEPGVEMLTLRCDDRSWSLSWADLGLRADPQATAQLAYQVGREGAAEQQLVDRLRALVAGWPLSPILILPDPARATAALEALAPDLVEPPLNADLVIRADGVTVVPARAGKELDVEASVAALPRAVSIHESGVVVQLLTRQVAPEIGNPAPAQAQAEALLARPFVLTANDLLTGFDAAWTAGADQVAMWLATEPVVSEGSARLMLTAREEVILAYLASLAALLPGDVALDEEGTTRAVRQAIEAGGSSAGAALVHPPQTYAVQPGDTLISIAQDHGFPLWRLIEANSGLDLDNLLPGQAITIPSLDVLFPFPLITDRRIVVDLSDQRLRAYEGDTRVFDLVASTGIASSPTIEGTFQVIGVEEQAYASTWDLWMPHFVGIYRSGPDFINGIHGLPTLSTGTTLWAGYLGRPVSYGCIVVGLAEAAALYEWVDVGVLVVIQD